MKNFTRFALCAVFALCSLTVSAYDFSATNSAGVAIYYNLLTSNTVEVTSGDEDYSGALAIPETVTYSGSSYTVTSIGTYAFMFCSDLTSVSIPNTVTYIDTYAFAWCYGITSITIPDGVTTIASRAFYDCPYLLSATIGSGVTEIGDYAFDECRSMTSVTLGDNVKTIGDYAFAYTDLGSITIGNSVTSIGAHAFTFCYNMTTATIGARVTSIGESAFQWCSNIYSLYSLNSTPPTLGSTVFDGVDTSYCTLYIPTGSRSLYSTADQWEDFLYVTEIYVDGIDNISKEGAEVTGYYTVDGKQVETLQKGINIVKYTDGTAKKLLVK